ncbi:MAG: polysaccharide biosynthesis C-terminal domain-containing protein [Rivularia sp. (in: Bacteria)]|nr:polysaccharide biosynthesis C-terminal domain-containing protein [Rivularia sp. MS3]
MKILRLENILIFWKKLTSGSTNRKIFGAAMIVGMGTLFVKVAAMFKELVVAWKFGTGDALDAFLIALLVPSFIINVVAGSLKAALIPTYMQVREKAGRKAAEKLFSGVTLASIVMLMITTALTLLLAPVYLPLIAAGFDREKLDLTFQLTYAISPLIVLSGIQMIWGGVLNAGERFALVAVSPILTPVITILLLLASENWGSFSLVAGLIVGGIAEMAILAVALNRQKISILPKWYGFNSEFIQVATQYAPTVAASFLMCSAIIIDQSMAAMLAPGSVAALTYGNRVVSLPILLVTTGLNAAVVPYFSKMIATEDWSGVNHTLKGYLKLIFSTTIPLTAIVIIFSELIVSLLFQRGSFTASDTRIVANIQNFYALQIPFYVSAVFIVDVIVSLRKSYILMWGSGLNLIANVAGNFIFMHFLGVKGIALSTSCVYLISFSFLLFFALKFLKQSQANN